MSSDLEQDSSDPFAKFGTIAADETDSITNATVVTRHHSDAVSFIEEDADAAPATSTNASGRTLPVAAAATTTTTSSNNSKPGSGSSLSSSGAKNASNSNKARKNSSKLPQSAAAKPSVRATKDKVMSLLKRDEQQHRKKESHASKPVVLTSAAQQPSPSNKRGDASASGGRRRTGLWGTAMIKTATTQNSTINFLKAKLDARRMLDTAAMRIQRWYRLIYSKIQYQRQLQRLRNTSAARVIQFAWLSYTFRVGPRREDDFSAWITAYKLRLLRKMRRLVRRELVRRRHAGMVIQRFVRWRVLRPLRAQQIKLERAARTIQRWYRYLTERSYVEKLQFGIEHNINHLFRMENSLRIVAGYDEHLEFVGMRILESEHRVLTLAGDHIEAYRLFLRRGGYDPRIARTQQRLVASEDLERQHLADDELAVRDNLRIEKLYQRQQVAKFLSASSEAAPSSSSSSSSSPSSLMLCDYSSNQQNRQRATASPYSCCRSGINNNDDTAPDHVKVQLSSCPRTTRRGFTNSHDDGNDTALSPSSFSVVTTTKTTKTTTPNRLRPSVPSSSPSGRLTPRRPLYTSISSFL